MVHVICRFPVCEGDLLECKFSRVQGLTTTQFKTLFTAIYSIFNMGENQFN